MSSLRIRGILKTFLPYVQLLYLYHLFRNRNTLTVVVFHRVLAVSDERWRDAHPEWTVSDTVFDECLQFFRRHYHVISLEDLLASLNEGAKLPSRSLLITFDDGYADNEEYALPLLKRHRLPAVLFLTSDFVNRRSRPWTEDLVSAFRQGLVPPRSLLLLHGSLFNERHAASGDSLKQLSEICAVGLSLSDREVEQLCTTEIGAMFPRPTDPPRMLSSEQLRRLHESGVAIGAHGKSHTSLPLSTDLESELNEPRRVLADLLDLPSVNDVSTLAFPFGDYSEAVVRSALDEGYKLLFTFRQAITNLRQGRLSNPIVDRINVSSSIIAPNGVATPERLARCFFFVPAAQVSTVIRQI